MFKYYLRARWRDYIGWGCLLLLMVVWFFADRDLTKPPVFTEETLPYVNISYGTDFATVEAAEQGLPAFMVARFFSFAAPRFNGSLWIVLLFSSLLLARLLGSPATQLPLRQGYSRIAHVLFLSLIFYLTLILLQGILILRHLLQMGFACFAIIDWGQLLHLFLYQAICLCGLVSITAFFAFATQSALFTALLSLGYLGAAVCLQPTPLFAHTPFHFAGAFVYVPPYDSDFITRAVLVSVVWVAVSTVASCVVYNRRDIRAE